jgi:lysyl-tRNA synthetase class 1
MSEETIIGHGTWYDMMAKKVIEREESLNRDLSRLRTEMGLGASGFPHIGAWRCIRSYAVTWHKNLIAI